MLNMASFSRKQTETNLDPIQQQPNGKRSKEDGNLFPKIKSIAAANNNNNVTNFVYSCGFL
jgi:hypothetical protein